MKYINVINVKFVKECPKRQINNIYVLKAASDYFFMVNQVCKFSFD